MPRCIGIYKLLRVYVLVMLIIYTKVEWLIAFFKTRLFHASFDRELQQEYPQTGTPRITVNLLLHPL